MTKHKLLIAIGFSLGTMALLTLSYTVFNIYNIRAAYARHTHRLELIDKAHSTYGEAMRVEVYDNGVLVISQECSK
ncbi:hypothetical protein LCGC14_2748730 [marine sediment metagenome]|uniref:Uncharacterized protein n=1 Tax=marine sediment metagenome TaxID=412755 RepID=A0A0F8ZPI8_9ZZZZ